MNHCSRRKLLRHRGEYRAKRFAKSRNDWMRFYRKLLRTTNEHGTYFGSRDLVAISKYRLERWQAENNIQFDPPPIKKQPHDLVLSFVDAETIKRKSMSLVWTKHRTGKAGAGGQNEQRYQLDDIVTSFSEPGEPT